MPHFPPKKTAKSARRAVALALLGVFALAAIAAYAAVGKPDWNIAASPSSATVSQGTTATFTIQVTRLNGFTGAVELATHGTLPPATKFTFSPTQVPSTTTSTASNSSALTVQTNVNGGTTPTGNYTVFLKGTSGKTVKYTAISLAVQAPATPNFSLNVLPSIQFIAQNDDASYTVKLTRSGSFEGPVTLGTYNLPDRVTATFQPSNVIASGADTATLELHSDHNAQEASHSFAVTGTGTIGASPTTRFGAVALNVETTKPFTVTGGVPQGFTFAPGAEAPLDLTVGNPHKFAIRIADLSVAVEEGTTARGCSGTVNFTVTQIPASRFNGTDRIWIPGQSQVKLSSLLSPSELPKVKMNGLAGSQDACKDARITLQYQGTGRK